MRCAPVLALMWFVGLQGLASPYTPQADDEPIERLPRRLAAAPRQAFELPQALGLAQAALQRARQEGDPRELGRAQALLAPWWQLPAPPPALRLLRASVLQAQHRFDAALQDLDALLAGAAPLALRAQAELTRAALLQLRGRWAEARAACTRLAGLGYAALGAAVPVHGRVCLAELDSLQGGDEARAAAALAQLARYPRAPRAWILLLRAELAERRGLAEAEALYRQALQAEPAVYTRAALADWLLARRRWADAAALVLAHEAEPTRLPDALLLRLAIAWRASGNARAGEAAAQLQERFDAAALRGDGSAHARERARYALDVRPDASEALQQAIANWALQREPADAWLLWRAARLPGAPLPLAAQARRAFEQFRRETGLQDARWSAAS